MRHGLYRLGDTERYTTLWYDCRLLSAVQSHCQPALGQAGKEYNKSRNLPSSVSRHSGHPPTQHGTLNLKHDATSGAIGWRSDAVWS